jgi:hypothetical protein
LLYLRRGAIEQIRKGLYRGFLTSHSFDIQFNDPNGTLVAVTYKDRPEFAFVLLHPETEVNSANNWKTIESPGRHFTTAETYEHPNFQQAQGSLFGWVDRIGEELLLEAQSHDDSTLLEQMRKGVSDTADHLPEPEKPFTEDELEDWSNQLTRLLTRLSELERQNEIQRGRVEQVSRQLEELKRQGTKIPKRTWLKTAGNKILDLLDSTSKAALKALAEGAVKALLEHKQ